MNTLRFVLDVVVGMALSYAVQRWDRRRLPPYYRDGAWNSVTWAFALYALGPYSMIPWVWVTRHEFWMWQRRDGLMVALLRSAGLLLVGVLAAGVLVAVVLGLDTLVGALVGAPE
jgi:hypothetical protein